jgi:hypothetical protein
MAMLAAACLWVPPVGLADDARKPESKLAVDREAVPAAAAAAAADVADELATRVFPLYNVPAADAETAIEKLLKQPANAKAVSAQPADAKAVVAADEVRNCVIVRATGEVLRAVEKRIAELDKAPRMVHAQCLLMEVGPDGKPHVLSRPQLMTIDGQEAVISIGQAVPIVGGPSTAQMIDTGYNIRVKAHLAEKDLARLEVVMEKKVAEEFQADTIRIVGSSVRIIKAITLGQPQKLIFEKNDQGTPRSWMELTLHEVKDPSSPKPTTQAAPAVAARTGKSASRK